MSRYDDIDPQDMNPDTGRPYSNYSSPSIDTSFHDGEMDVENDEDDVDWDGESESNADASYAEIGGDA